MLHKIDLFKYFPVLFLTMYLSTMMAQANTNEGQRSTETTTAMDMMIRIAEIEIDSSAFDKYIAILKEEAAASIKLEPGVIAIFPMYQKENPTQIRLVEIYANKAAYQAHLKTPHFQHYKTATLDMVKSLNLVEMEAIDVATMQEIFKKMK